MAVPDQNGYQGYPSTNKWTDQSRVLAQSTSQIRSHVQTNIIRDNQYEIDRVTRYYLFWKFYEGLHYKDFNDAMLSFNYARAFVDKQIMFLLGKDAFSIHTKSWDSEVIPKDIEKIAEKVIMYHWNRNKKSTKAWEILQMGSVMGDVWVGLEWEDVRKFCKVNVFDSRQCFPIFEDGDYNKLSSFTLRYALTDHPKEYKLRVYSYTKDKIYSWYQKTPAEVTPKVAFQQKNTGDIYEMQTEDNPYGFIPVVHIKNKPNGAGYYGKSDLSDILKINKVYNEMMQTVKSIIDYHATPTTVITGGSARNLRRGLGNIWSGLPSEANVFNLGLDVDLSSTDNYLKTLKTSMHELSDIPENTLGKLQSISNTSGAALAITYQPLIQEADLKAVTYGEGIAELNSMMFTMQKVHDPENKNLVELAAALPDYQTALRMDPVFNYGLPQDRQGDLNMGMSEINAGLASRREVMERLGKDNIPELLDEIEDDKMSDAVRGQVLNSLMTDGMETPDPAADETK